MVDAQLHRLLDEDAVRRLARRYSDAVKHLDATRAAAVYVDDGCVDIAGQKIIGRAAIEEGMRGTFAAFSLLQLIQHSEQIDVHRDQATARWSTIELTVRHGNEHLNVIFGRYQDALVRGPDGWKFKQRSFSLAGRTQLSTAKLQVDPRFFESL